jgi:hypothetical protein
VIFLSSSGVTSTPCRSVKKSVVSKSLKNVVQSTMETQVSNLAIFDRPPRAINLANRSFDSGLGVVWVVPVDFVSEGREAMMEAIVESSSGFSMDSANS